MQKKTRSRHIVVHLHKCSFSNSLHTDHNVIASFKKPMGGSVEPTEPPTDQYTGSPGRGELKNEKDGGPKETKSLDQI